ncbi:hypothetical protein FJR38_09620 [Anabaena sp. UHCC 0253]|uniref:hypothetical protein n=1 Tax=Anabaena sp. UHCC 0253 TaxID=2590019 RepID=UPI0014479D22|nr:hypothetical protein [Anabaena sp. UHCC 0253]MTJ52890.1 hypothetical protein [Anabaena sp. UHCC 0253]
MSNVLFSNVPIEQQETIIGGVGDVNIGDINTQGKNNVVTTINNITIINMMFNFFLYPRSPNRKNRRCKF